MNTAVGIRLKIDPSGLQKKFLSSDFPQILELLQLRTHIGGYIKNVNVNDILVSFQSLYCSL